MFWSNNRLTLNQRRRTYKEQVPYSVRSVKSAALRKKNPDRIPVVLEPAHLTQWPSVISETTQDVDFDYQMITLDYSKLLLPGSFTVGQALIEVKKERKIRPDEAIWLYVNEKHLAPSTMRIRDLDAKYRDEDGFLYLCYGVESVFG